MPGIFPDERGTITYPKRLVDRKINPPAPSNALLDNGQQRESSLNKNRPR
jgi:hypothetical protein